MSDVKLEKPRSPLMFWSGFEFEKVGYATIVLSIVIIVLVSMTVYDRMIALIFVGTIELTYLYFLAFLHKKM